MQSLHEKKTRLRLRHTCSSDQQTEHTRVGHDMDDCCSSALRTARTLAPDPWQTRTLPVRGGLQPCICYENLIFLFIIYCACDSDSFSISDTINGNKSNKGASGAGALLTALPDFLRRPLACRAVGGWSTRMKRYICCLRTCVLN